MASQYFSRFGQCEFLDIDQNDLDTSSLHARLVKSPTREILLSSRQHRAPSSPDANLEASILLADLGRLAPSVVKDFIPKEHVESTFAFRLMNDVGFRGEEDGYIAISYCWEKTAQNTPRSVITPVEDLPFGWTKEVEQFPLPTSPAMFQAVIRERDIGEGLWFDQVCVNQEDDHEKARTMAAIDIIYKNARIVVVALDDIVVTQEEEQFLRYYSQQYSYSEIPSHQQPNLDMSPPFLYHYSVLTSFIDRVLSSAWFDRAWCSHEMRMGQSHVFLVPCFSHYEDEDQTFFRFTGTFLLHLLFLASELTTHTPTTKIKIASLLQFFQSVAPRLDAATLAVQRPNKHQLSASDERCLALIIADTFRMHAGGNSRLPEYLRRLDANRDKTCIALNASGLPLAMAPASPFSRPDIVDECLRSLLLVGLAARDPTPLCTTGTPLQLHDGSTSWLCRPTSFELSPGRPRPPRFRNRNTITQSSDGRAEYAQLDLIFLELPHRTHPNPLFPAYVARARTVIDLCIQHQVPGSGLWAFSQAPDHPRTLGLRNIFIQTLACIFTCGPQWLLEATSSLPRTKTPVPDAYTLDILLNLHLNIQNYILLPSGRSALSFLVTFVSSLIAIGLPWASGASERTHGPLIVTAPLPSWSNQYSDYPRSPNPGSKAIIFAPFVHSKTLLIAVPDAVKGAEYEGLARGWILTSMNPYTGSPKGMVSWTLQGKGVVFGDVGFNAGLEGCGGQDVRNHRVYGPLKV